MREMGRFLADVCPALCPAFVPFGDVLRAEADAFHADFLASVSLTATALPDGVYFVPPIARAGFAPFASMIESTLAEYSNFRE